MLQIWLQIESQHLTSGGPKYVNLGLNQGQQTAKNLMLSRSLMFMNGNKFCLKLQISL